MDPRKITKRQRGMRLNGNLTVNASVELERLCKKFDIGRYAIISTALIYYADRIRKEEDPVVQLAKAPATSKTASSLDTLKKTWCMEFGGDLEGGLCMFNKYEVTLAGETEISRRQVAIQDMPNEKEEMRKYMLGPYQNKYEAERAASK
jgi:hypothetical protein